MAIIPDRQQMQQMQQAQQMQQLQHQQLQNILSPSRTALYHQESESLSALLEHANYC